MMLPMIVAALSIGSGFNLTNMVYVSDVFDKSEVERHKVVIENPATESKYKMIESASDVSDFLNVEGELSLSLMKGKFQINGAGEYLSKTVDRTKTVEILLVVKTRQKTVTLPTNVEPKAGWESRMMGNGSHYIRSMVYGGVFLVTYKMTSKDSESLEKIKAVVKANLETSGSINGALEGKLDKIEKDLSKVSSTEVYAYTKGGPFEGEQPSDLASAFKLIKEFPDKLKSHADQNKYTPMFFELEPLSTLSEKFTKEKESTMSNEILDQAIDKYEDLRLALSQYSTFQETHTTENVPELKKFKKHVVNTKNKLDDAIGKLNLSGVFDMNDFKEAFDLYAEGGINVPNRYTREVNALINAQKGITPPWYPFTRAVNEYIHWGNTSCTLPSPDPIIVGFAASSPTKYGSGSNIQCLEPKPSLGKEIPRSPLDPLHRKKSFITGLTYRKPFTGSKEDPTHAVDLESHTLLCARCLLSNATSVFTVPAKNDCPEGTKLEYGGFLATGSVFATDTICIDHNTVDELKGFTVQTNDDKANTIMPMWSRETTLREMRYIPCVVCSR